MKQWFDFQNTHSFHSPTQSIPLEGLHIFHVSVEYSRIPHRRYQVNDSSVTLYNQGRKSKVIKVIQISIVDCPRQKALFDTIMA